MASPRYTQSLVCLSTATILHELSGPHTLVFAFLVMTMILLARHLIDVFVIPHEQEADVQ